MLVVVDSKEEHRSRFPAERRWCCSEEVAPLMLVLVAVEQDWFRFFAGV